MKSLQRVASFLAFFCLCASATWLLFSEELLEAYYVVRWGGGSECYRQVADVPDGSICLARWEDRKKDTLNVRYYSREGKRLASWKVSVPEEVSSLDFFLPVDRDTALVGLYSDYENPDDGWWYQRSILTICVARSSGELTQLYSESSNRDTGMDCVADLRVSSGMNSLNGAELAVLHGDELIRCSWDRKENVMTHMSMGTYPNALCAAILPDGSAVVGGEDFLQFGDNVVSLPGHEATSITVSERGLYIFDDAKHQISYSDFTGMDYYVVNVLGERMGGDTMAFGSTNWRVLTDWVLTERGTLLSLRDGNTVYEADRDNIRQIPVHAPTYVCVMQLAAAVAADLLLSLLLCLYFFVARKGRMSLALHWGFVVFALAFSFWTAYANFYIAPAARKSLMDMRETFVLTSVDVAFSSGGATDDKQRSSQVAEALEYTGLHHVDVHMLHESENGWITQDGEHAKMMHGFSEELMRMMVENDYSSYVYMPSYDTSSFWAVEKVPGGYVYVYAASMSDDEIRSTVAYRTSRIIVAVMGSIAFACFVAIHLDVRRIAKGVERYAGEQEWKRVEVQSEDELTGIASTLNALAEERAARRRENDRQVESYRRFVPEQVLSLLGKSTILEVDKTTVASRRMAFLSVRFRFPQEFYSARGRQIFEEVNRVLERTVDLAAQKGGTVFNFSNNGFDVVMEAEPERAASTAVAISQAALAINEEAKSIGGQPVKLRVALDMGELTLGVVGNDELLMPAALSTSIARIEALLALCDCLDASILCTDSVSQGTKAYGSRYMGKCCVDGTEVRVSEIYDGDAYELRKNKSASARRFAEGVSLLYTGGVEQAKRVFLELVHETPDDGGARYYLYLADRIERVPDTVCELNAAFKEIWTAR